MCIENADSFLETAENISAFKSEANLNRTAGASKRDRIAESF
jgi:hypothetical protein